MIDDSWSPILINGSIRRSFIFPGSLPQAFDYFQNYQLIFELLPHISLLQQIGKNQFRLKYDTIELGLYRVEIFCEVEVVPDFANQILNFNPAVNQQPGKSKAGIYSISGQGAYSSQSRFIKHGQNTAIFYDLQLYAKLPTPWGLRFMPEMIRNRVAASITHHRIVEIADTFITRSIQIYQQSGDPYRSG